MFEQYTDDFIDEELFPSGKLFRISFDNTVAQFRILARDSYDFEKLQDAFSDYNQGAFFSKQYGFNAETKVYAVGKFGHFHIGLIFEILNYIRREYSSLDCLAMSNNAKRFMVDYLLPMKRFAKTQDRDKFTVLNISKEKEMRDYQIAAIKALIFDGCGRGLIELPTGSGKSFVIANFIYTLLKRYDSGLRTLILVPNRQLVEQFYKDLIEYGFKKEELTRLAAGLKKDEKYDPSARIIISNRQFLFTNAQKLPKIDVLVADEVHTTCDPKSSTYRLIDGLNCAIKIGCSGTIPRDKFKRWSLMGLFSRILYTEDIVNLQNRGYLTKMRLSVVSVTDLQIEQDRNIPFNLKSTVKYVEGGDIAFNEAYNAETEYTNKNCLRLYQPMIDKISSLKGNVLILFDRIEFGHELTEILKELHPRDSEIHYIDGSIAIETREDIRKKLEETDNNILVAQSTTFSVGLNIKNLPNLCFTGGGKSLVKCIQSIGRTLRLHENKEYAELIDCCFNFKYSRKHFKERMKLYREFYHKDKPDEIQKVTI